MWKPGQRRICKVFFVPETGYYGFSYQFDDNPPHHVLDTCQTMQDAIDACDGHREHIWEDHPDGSEPNVLQISYGYREGTCNWVMDAAALDEIKARSASALRPLTERL